jgi:hypothetical protein
MGKYDANDDMNHYQNLLTTNNGSIECPPLQRIVEMGCESIQQMHQLANVTKNSMPILNDQQNMTEKIDEKAIFNEWRNAQFVQKVRKSIERFKENATRLANITSGPQAREVMANLTRRNLSESEQLTAFAHEKIAMYTEYAEVLKARLDNNTREITEKTSQFMSNLNQIRNWKTEEKDLKRAIVMLEGGLADMNEVKGNWAHLGNFFARFSQIIETITSYSVGDFIQQLNTTIGTPSYKRNEGIKGIEIKKMRDKTVRVNKVLTVANELATTYYNISRDYLMPRVHRLQFLMDVSTKNSSHLDSERDKLLDACEKDVITIQQLISDEKRRLLEKVNATVRQIVESNYRFLQTNRTDTNPTPVGPNPTEQSSG